MSISIFYNCVDRKNRFQTYRVGLLPSQRTCFFVGKGFRAVNIYTTGISCVETRNQQTSCWISVVAVSLQTFACQLACLKHKTTLVGIPEYIASTSSREEGLQARGKKDAHARQRAALPPDDPNTYAMWGFRQPAALFPLAGLHPNLATGLHHLATARHGILQTWWQVHKQHERDLKYQIGSITTAGGCPCWNKPTCGRFARPLHL